MRRLFVVVFTLLYITPLFAQAKHPFAFEDMMALKRVGEPVASPDGKRVLFSAVDVSLYANTKTPHIWTVPLAGGKEHMIIASQDADRPRWSPDGRHFAFISNKEGGSQVWIADFNSRSGTVTGVHKFTSIATEAGAKSGPPRASTSSLLPMFIQSAITRRTSRRPAMPPPSRGTRCRR